MRFHREAGKNICGEAKVAILSLAFSFAAMILIVAAPGVSAQGFAPPQPPPIGDGSSPAPVIPGDTGGVPAVSTGAADGTPGHNFPVGVGRDRSVVRVFNNGARGQREVTTIRPDQLSNDELSQIEGILGVNLRSGEQTIDVTASNAQIEQINQVLAPYPNAQNSGGRKQITADSPAASYPRTPSLYGLDASHPLPTVWTFSRYLVILGVVSATIFMALAAWSMVLGHPYGAARVVGAAAGLLMLLSAYTIWKIVQMNTFNANSDTPATINTGATTAQVQDAFMARPSVPATPGGATSTGRSGFPVQPLRNAQN
ncbi:MAG TPA: hypothetical protein PKD05_09585 [Candidatus Melainabacteria bacterium]|nr:hypothetical protein [Candidatus Melainabacteria bacterium]